MKQNSDMTLNAKYSTSRNTYLRDASNELLNTHFNCIGSPYIDVYPDVVKILGEVLKMILYSRFIWVSLIWSDAYMRQ